MSVLVLLGSFLIGIRIPEVGPLRSVKTSHEHIVGPDGASGVFSHLLLDVENVTRSSVTIFGIKENCQSYLVSDVPIEIKPKGQISLRIGLKKRGLGRSVMYDDRGVMIAFVGDGSVSQKTVSVPVFWFLKEY